MAFTLFSYTTGALTTDRRNDFGAELRASLAARAPYALFERKISSGEVECGNGILGGCSLRPRGIFALGAIE
jgi:hypothetical protein